jgi:hypothetical protein
MIENIQFNNTKRQITYKKNWQDRVIDDSFLVNSLWDKPVVQEVITKDWDSEVISVTPINWPYIFLYDFLVWKTKQEVEQFLSEYDEE